jgi:hypothetical protein
MDPIDHLLLGVSNLDEGIAWVDRLTGVRAAPGGSHPGVGTRNALLSLGGRRYLEIIAPDPAQRMDASRFALRTLAAPRLITWAAATSDIDALAERLARAGRQVIGPDDGARTRPDGRMLRWRTLGIPSDLARDGIDPVPFYIQWSADSAHPSEDSPEGCTLQSFEIVHPDSSAVSRVFRELGIEAAVTGGSAVRIIATFDTPHGCVQFS